MWKQAEQSVKHGSDSVRKPARQGSRKEPGMEGKAGCLDIKEGNADMKKFLNIRVVVTGFLTALLLTAASLGAYFFYCSELRLMEDSPEVVEDAGTPPDQILKNPDQQTLEYLLGFHYVLYKEAYANRLVQQGEESYISYQDLFFEEKSEPKGFDGNSLEQYNNVVSNRRLSVNAYLLGLEQNLTGSTITGSRTWRQKTQRSLLM